ncbi:DUF4875 domain-containing protein [Marinicella meishanensis]|uniref:DUF4875 domain-containing protein n=1 Tax=Marinicella meishanensis TaxID=2873263 RepID=UPI001CC0AD4F|nr:DUF4875 domain-containing protein [Marinicella sp. NBU2979]
MKPARVLIFQGIKLVLLIFLLIVVFNFFFDQAKQNQQAESIETMLTDLEDQVRDLQHSKQTIMLPLIRRPAAEYQVVVQNTEVAGDESYAFLCAVSQAVGQAQRAQTMVNVVEDHKDMLSDGVGKMVVYLAAAKSLCEETLALGVGYHVLDGQGWPGISAGQWHWLLRTSNVQVTAAQIEASELFQKHREEFIQEHGVYDYFDHLDAHVSQLLNRKADYVKTGMWNDDFVKH